MVKVINFRIYAGKTDKLGNVENQINFVNKP